MTPNFRFCSVVFDRKHRAKLLTSGYRIRYQTDMKMTQISGSEMCLKIDNSIKKLTQADPLIIKDPEVIRL